MSTDFEQEALDYLKQEAENMDQYDKWSRYFHSTLFLLMELSLPAETRGEIMQVAYDIVNEE